MSACVFNPHKSITAFWVYRQFHFQIQSAAALDPELHFHKLVPHIFVHLENNSLQPFCTSMAVLKLYGLLAVAQGVILLT